MPIKREYRSMRVNLWEIRFANQPEHSQYVAANSLHDALSASAQHQNEIISIRWLGDDFTLVATEP